MPRLSKKEEELKSDALWLAYEKLKSRGIDVPSHEMIIKMANSSDEIKKCKKNIGEKTLAQSKNEKIEKLRNHLKKERESILKLKNLVPSELSIKIEQLHSSLAANAILANKIENLENRLRGKNEIITQKEIRINEFVEEIKKLKMEIKYLKEMI